ncbi:hypothetical protein GN958_ATG22404 [Phytophthora infestans]|uniref:AB hydrolase-1 domain-containing protein n=1 Tax=Phytophthora infestans TaxID=4787 RepID=A0A8S9THM3_PHYIN|nr:hypothetical protein GN958_ATG22404 [Phytophthora infestans]
MQLRYVLLVTVTIVQSLSAEKIPSNSSSSLKLNGWYPCSDYTFSDSGSTDAQNAECATYSAPLCYPGVCEAPDGVDQTVDIFVKRLPAASPKTASNIWVLEGGPGYASNGLESLMATLHQNLKGTVNVYTMDHRGTGRSTLLDCQAAQAFTSGSPGKKSIDYLEFPPLERKYGDLASFSTTSAAKDVVTLLSEVSNGEHTVIYGISYGSLLVERVIHLDPPNVVGYVMDGIATTARASNNEFPYISRIDTDAGKVGEMFLTLCAKDRSCYSHLKKPRTLTSTLQKLLVQFDKDPNSTCATIVADSEVGSEGSSASDKLREVLSALLLDPNMRNAIPPLIYRLDRCRGKDIKVLGYFFGVYGGMSSTSDDEGPYFSELLYFLIVFSEEWERPQASMSEMKQRFTDNAIAPGIYKMSPLYCAFSKEKSKACQEFNNGNYDAHGIVYKRDRYWSVSATIPRHASVLLMSSKLDVQTPVVNHRYQAGFHCHQAAD